MSSGPATHVRGNWKLRLRSLQNLPPLLRIALASSPGFAISLFALRVISGLIPFLILAVTKRIVDVVVLLLAGSSHFVSGLWWLLALECGLAILASSLHRAIDFCDAQVADRFALHMSVTIMEHASQLDLANYEDPVFHDKLERARAQVTDRIATVQALGRLFEETVTVASLAVGIVAYSSWYVIILLIAIIPVFVGDSYFAFRGYLLAFRQTSTRREIDYVRLLGSNKESAKELKLFGLSPHWVALYKALTRKVHEQNMELTRSRLIAGIAFSFVSIAGYYAAYALAAYQTIRGHLSLGSLTFLAGAIARTSATLQSVFASLGSLADQALFLQDLFEVFAVKPRVCAPLVPIKISLPMRRFEFRNVTFAYPGGSEPVLKDLTFSLNAGERVALVGSNGSGKTTIVKLLMRLYDPTSGQILLDGIDLRNYDLGELHQQCAILFQDFVRYDRSVDENIRIGDVTRQASGDALEDAARLSGAHDFVMHFPRKYRQMLGRRFEDGVDISGGEWQRIALARAYFRDCQLLILDEPSASLDGTAEVDLMRRFNDPAGHKMILLISHRFSTVRMADRILVLECGRIVEEGSHAELTRQPTRYSEMFELQASQYR